MRRPHVFTTHFIFTALCVTYIVLAFSYPKVYIWATYEDLLGEWAQFWLFVFTFVVSVKLLLHKTRYRLTFALLALACFYVAMEEISWGQRVLGFTSPDFFKKGNLQSETNLHNFATGPYSTLLKTSLGYLLATALVSYGVIYPLLLRRGAAIAVWFDARGVASPPLALAPFFVTGAFLETSPFRFNEAEFAELLVGFAVCFTAIHYAFAVQGKIDPHDSRSWAPDASSRLAMRFWFTAILVLSFAANTALGIYATPNGRERLDNRIANGVEKFAGRYGKYGRWEIAVELLRENLEQKPTSRSILRKLSNATRETGDDSMAKALLVRAVELDLAKLKQDPDAASTHRSLIRSYRAMSDEAEAEKHAEAALRIGMRRIAEHPDSANAAYSLGRTYSLLGREDESFLQLERAFKLKPTSKGFKKAYLKAKHNR